MNIKDCKTLKELEEIGHYPAMRSLLAERAIIILTKQERRELEKFAAAWMAKYEELTEGQHQ